MLTTHPTRHSHPSTPNSTEANSRPYGGQLQTPRRRERASEAQHRESDLCFQPASTPMATSARRGA
eukprot:12593240-Alexandrium_andersonii.AAC.1